MKMCYRGVHYDYNPIVFELNERQKYFIDHSLDNTREIINLAKTYHKKAVIPVTEKQTRFSSQIENDSVVDRTKVQETA